MTIETSKNETTARAALEDGFAQASKAFSKMNDVTTEAASLFSNNCSTTIKGVQNYNAKAVEFAQTNIAAAIDFTQKMWGVKAPTEFTELSTNHFRKQCEALTKQTKELTELAQKVVAATTQPVMTDFTKAFS